MEIDVHNILSSYIKRAVEMNLSSQFFIENDPVENIYERLALIDYLERNMNVFQSVLVTRSLLVSLQVYLLLSASDTLSKGPDKRYSFIQYSRTDKCRSDLVHFEGKKFSYALFQEIVAASTRGFEREQMVKIRFKRFWNERREEIKRKIVLCYFPRKFADWQDAYNHIIDLFYQEYRNPFTHSALNNFPPVRAQPAPSIVNMQTLLGVAYESDSQGPKRIELPLFPEEASEIFQLAKKFYFVTETGDLHEKEIGSIDELMELNIQLCSYKRDIGKTAYLHNGIILLLKMAVLEGTEEYKARNKGKSA